MCYVQVLQAAFVDKTAQLQALQQQLTGQHAASPELAALHQDMLNAQVYIQAHVNNCVTLCWGNVDLCRA